MKKTNKVSINLTDEDYALLTRQAEKERRPIAQLTAIIVEDCVRASFLKEQGEGIIKPARFIKTERRN